MKLYIKQKVFTWGDKFTVKDEQGQDIYQVKGKVISFGKSLKIYDIKTNTIVAKIRQKLFHVMAHYKVSITDQKPFMVVKRLKLFTPSFKVKALKWDVDGDFLAHDYTVTSTNEMIMKLNKRYVSWGDSYELNITKEENQLACISIAIVADAVMSSNASRRRY
ncbi:MAG: LURP-one-related family protein [Bacillales bacterium]|jgi:uncharacterized protein YxjI|nr:LURP-one-related family protein [Bacillales bacterium]